MAKQWTCPICKKIFKYNTVDAVFPFCSERCKLIDLGQWADGSYHIAGEQVSLEQIQPDDEPLH